MSESDSTSASASASADAEAGADAGADAAEAAEAPGASAAEPAWLAGGLSPARPLAAPWNVTRRGFAALGRRPLRASADDVIADPSVDPADGVVASTDMAAVGAVCRGCVAEAAGGESNAASERAGDETKAVPRRDGLPVESRWPP